MVQRKIGQLSESDSQLLVAASVQGYDFDSAVVATALQLDPADVEERLVELERVYNFVHRRDEHEFPDGTITTRYRFVHVLYQNILYGSLSVSRRVHLSRAVAETLLKFQKAAPGPFAAELGFLFESARDADRASHFFSLAARSAAKVFANQEAAVLARRGLSLLAKVEDSNERQRRELSLQSVLGTSLAATQGYAAADVLVAMARARVLAEELGQQPELAPVIWGLFAYYLVSGDLPEARTVSDQFLRFAESTNDPLLLVGAHCAMGICLYYFGEVQRANDHCSQAAKYYETDKRPLYHAMYRMDPGVFFHSEKARTLFLLGKADEALNSRDAALALGKDSPDPRSYALPLLFASVVHQFRREVKQTLDYSAKAIAVCDEHGIAQERVWALAIHGWALAHSGHAEEGIKEIEASLGIQRSRHAELNLTYAMRMLADSFNTLGRYVEARDTAREGLKISERHGEVASKVELYRIMGESAAALARTGEIDAASHTRSGSTLSPEACFRAAVELARKQGAIAFELRAAVSLAREMHDRGLDTEARALVQQIRDQFTEGLDTPDIKDADSFLSATAPQ